MSYMTISSQENHNFSLCSYFHAHPTTLLLKIWGEPMHGPSPTSNFGGTVPPVPPRSQPLPRPSRPIVVKCEAQHCSFVLYFLFGVKITFSIPQIQNFRGDPSNKCVDTIVFHCLKNVK